MSNGFIIASLVSGLGLGIVVAELIRHVCLYVHRWFYLRRIHRAYEAMKMDD